MQALYKEIIFTPENLEDRIDEVFAIDMSDEIKKAVESKSEDLITYQSLEEYSLCFFPNAGRGGIVTNGETDWTDCSSVDDLEERWANYDEKWCN